MESNHNYQFRKLEYYPLYYAGKIGSSGRTRTDDKHRMKVVH